MTICPCCGFKSPNSGTGVLSVACTSCGAHSVGEPLPRPENELPSFGRSLLLAVIGTLTVLVFLADTIISWYARTPLAFDFWSVMAGAETAAWHLKWAMIPFSLLVYFGSRKIYRSVKAAPESFCAQRAARNGYFASAAMPCTSGLRARTTAGRVGSTATQRRHPVHREHVVSAGSPGCAEPECRRHTAAGRRTGASPAPPGADGGLLP